jgi:predicted alpha/beta-hydrolase family hydrolase
LAQQEFTLETESGPLSATLNQAESASHTLLLAHGAGADHQHHHMTSLANAFEAQRITTLRFNFPFKQHGRNRVDSKAVSVNCISAAATWLQTNHRQPLLIGGHSFGGRMATHAVAEHDIECTALVLCSFPLHPAGKPSTERAAHLKDISPPMIFLSGTRDKLADKNLLEAEVRKLNSSSRVHWLDTGDHSFNILKRSRNNAVEIYTEAAAEARTFIDAL